MPRFALSALSRARRAGLPVAAVLVVCLLTGSVAVAVTAGDAAPEVAPPEPVAAGPAHDGLSSQQALALAFDERLAAMRLAARVVPTTQPPAPKPRASRAASRPRPAPVPPPAPLVRAAATGPVVWPAAGQVTGTYGEPRGGKRHPGLDIDGETGDPVWAAAKGVVTWAGPAPAGYSGYGTIVLIDHGDGLETLYAHLSSVTIAAGAAVEPGVQVGRIGTTGNVTGSHLHFEVRRGGVQTDPLAFLPPR